MHKRTVAYLSLFILFSFVFGSVQSVHSEKRQFWAVCIDNNQYGEHEFGEHVMHSLMAGGWEKGHIKLVEENSSNAVLNSIGWLVSHSGRDDMVFFYFSGHGYNGGIIAVENGISYEELGRELDKIRCRGMLIVIDACHSGSAISFLEKKNRVLITSCRGNETSGYFSEPFVNALGIAADCSGNLDCTVSAEEIFRYIMSDWSVGSYTPQMRDRYEGNMSVLSVNMDERKVDVCQVHAQQALDNFGGEKWLRQSFVANSYSILGVSLKIAKWKNASDMKLEVYDSNFTFVGGTVIHTGNAYNIDNICMWISADMDMDVVPGKKYFLVCRSNSTWWWWGSGDWYDGGKAYASYDGGASWQETGKISDFGFIVYGKKDKTPPEIFILSPAEREHLSGQVSLSWYASDNDDEDLNGSIEIFYKADGGWEMIAEGLVSEGSYWWNSAHVKDGYYQIKVNAVDSSGNVGGSIVPIAVDNTPPETSCDLYGKMGRHNWYVGNATVILSSYDYMTDMQNVSTYYRIDDGRWRFYSKPLIVSSDGKHNFSFYGKDEAGNAEEEKKTVIRIDCTPPNISFVMPAERYLYMVGRKIIPLVKNTVVVGKMMVEVMAFDNLSGVSQVKFFMDGNEKFADKEAPYKWELPPSFFRHEIKCVARDDAGNSAEASQTILSFTI